MNMYSPAIWWWSQPRLMHHVSCYFSNVELDCGRLFIREASNGNTNMTSIAVTSIDELLTRLDMANLIEKFKVNNHTQYTPILVYVAHRHTHTHARARAHTHTHTLTHTPS